MSNLPCPWYPGYVTNFWGGLEGVCNLVLCLANVPFPGSLIPSLLSLLCILRGFGRGLGFGTT